MKNQGERPLPRFLSRRAKHSLRDYVYYYGGPRLDEFLNKYASEPDYDARQRILRQLIEFAEHDKDTINAFEWFINQEGRRQRRVIDMPDTSYKNGHEELISLANEIIGSKHRPSIRAAIASMEVDLDWTVEMDTTQADRVARRLRAVIEQLAAALTEHAEAEQILHCPRISPIYEAIQTVSQELIQYIAEHPRVLYHIKPRQFEELITEILKGFCWDVELTPETRDGGYDILAVAKDVENTGIRTSYIVECKKYGPDRKVGIGVVRQLLHIKADVKASHAILATTSDFTRGVYDYAIQRMDFDLKNFQSIVEWCRNYRRLRS